MDSRHRLLVQPPSAKALGPARPRVRDLNRRGGHRAYRHSSVFRPASHAEEGSSEPPGASSGAESLRYQRNVRGQIVALISTRGERGIPPSTGAATGTRRSDHRAISVGTIVGILGLVACV